MGKGLPEKSARDGDEKPERGPSASERQEFIRCQYELIAGHATQQTSARWTYVQLSLVALAIFYAALFSRDMSLGDSKALEALIWLPVLLVSFGWARAWSIHKGIMDRNKLLKRIEEYHSFAGWAHVVDHNWRASFAHRHDMLINVYWVFLFIFTVAAALSVNLDVVCLRPQGCA